jgi:hypothetical protein
MNNSGLSCVAGVTVGEGDTSGVVIAAVHFVYRVGPALLGVFEQARILTV